MGAKPKWDPKWPKKIEILTLTVKFGVKSFFIIFAFYSSMCGLQFWVEMTQKLFQSDVRGPHSNENPSTGTGKKIESKTIVLLVL